MTGSSTTFRVAVFIVCLLAELQEAVGQHQRLRFEHLTLKDGLSHSTVESIAQGAHGFLWFGTSDGLNRYDDSSFRTYRHVSGDSTTLSSSAIESLFVDSQARLWIGTQNGLNRYDPMQDEFVHYPLGREDSTDIDYIYDIAEDHDGRLWIATLGGGVNRIDPDAGSVTSYRHRPGDPQSLASNYMRSIEPGGLVGFDDEWQTAGSRRDVSYTNLDPGAYIFRVKGSNNSCLWNSRGTSLTVTVQPPPSGKRGNLRTLRPPRDGCSRGHSPLPPFSRSTPQGASATESQGATGV